jgi:trehalose-phosphatase
MAVSAFPVTSELASRLASTPLVLFLDVDGTLSPIAPRPEYAVLPLETKRVLCDLVELPGVHIAILSGRAAGDARRVVDVPGVWVVGNHGLEIAPPDGPPEVRPDVAAYETKIAAAAARAEPLARAYAGVIVEDKRWTLSVHYRLAHPRIVPELSAETESIAADCGLLVIRGKEVLELRPPVDVDKGVAAVELARSLRGAERRASLLCAGDDRTDEDAFRALRATWPECVTVRVGLASDTKAEFVVPDTAAMRELLAWILASRKLSEF